jgi:16S rRNA (guanine(1405)-N(7))-methyltransferase
VSRPHATCDAMGTEIDQVVTAVRESRKYRHICPDTILRTATWAAARSRSAKEATKRAKRKLHQVYGAYLDGWDPGALSELVEGVPHGADLESVRPICTAVMQQHTSTRERLDVIEGFYGKILGVTGVPRRVLDLGCGLHPFALPWMGLPEDVEYAAWDIDGRVVALVNGFFARVGLPQAARCQDVFAAEAGDEVDLAFLLKMLPCLEQQEKGSGARLLGRIRAPFVVVSFPARSLGGRDKGMAAHYGGTMEATLSDSGWRAEKIEAGRELLYVIDKT